MRSTTTNSPVGEGGAVGSDNERVRGNEQHNPSISAAARAPGNFEPPAAHLRLICSGPSVISTNLADHRIKVTFFGSVSETKRKKVRNLTLPQLRDNIHKTTRRSKRELPLLKLAGFGDKLNDKGSLRWNGNVNS